MEDRNQILLNFILNDS